MVNREQMIEKAAQAIDQLAFAKPFGQMVSSKEAATAALAVFEEAHAPTCKCTQRQVQYDDGEWSRELEVDVSGCPIHAHDERAEWTATLEALLADVYTILKPLAENRSHGASSPILKAYALLNAQEFTRRTVQGEPTATCPKCGTTVTDQTPSTFYTRHDETCGGVLEEPQGEPTSVYVVAVDYAWDGYGPPERAFASRDAAEAYVAESSQSTYADPEIFELEIE